VAVDGTVAVCALPEVTDTTDPVAVAGTEMRMRAW
jgi:hypothetical protein